MNLLWFSEAMSRNCQYCCANGEWRASAYEALSPRNWRNILQISPRSNDSESADRSSMSAAVLDQAPSPKNMSINLSTALERSSVIYRQEMSKLRTSKIGGTSRTLCSQS